MNLEEKTGNCPKCGIGNIDCRISDETGKGYPTTYCFPFRFTFHHSCSNKDCSYEKSESNYAAVGYETLGDLVCPLCEKQYSFSDLKK